MGTSAAFRQTALMRSPYRPGRRRPIQWRCMCASQLPIAIVGMAGAGKSEVSKLLVKEYGFERVYFGQVVIDELTSRGLPQGPESERLVREQLRTTEGMAVMATRSLPRIQAALSEGRRVCIDGLYSGAEWRLLARETGVITIAVHASRWLRKRRLAVRPSRPLSSAELDDRDISEAERLDKAMPIALADVHVVNDGDIDGLRRAVVAVLEHVDEVTASRLDPRVMAATTSGKLQEPPSSRAAGGANSRRNESSSLVE
jgi:dephospho-CoA kinase